MLRPVAVALAWFAGIPVAAPAVAQQACPPSVRTGSITADIVKLEKQGGQLIITYVVQSNYNVPMTIHPSHWGHHRHIVRDNQGNEWAYQRQGAGGRNFRIDPGERQRGILPFTLREGDPSGDTFSATLFFSTLPAGGGVKLGQSRILEAKWTGVKVGCVTTLG